MSRKLKKEALNYHSQGRKGKIEVVPTKGHSTQRDLSLAYSPGVAEPCLEIEKKPQDVYKYTAKGNLVAVISNGTAVLGLGNIGAAASKPVMEGKGLLFKIFADIDVFDIEVDETDIDKFIATVKAISPTFGGINLEDIKAPEAFEIERRLKEELNIPVMHDDQHGTAIISAASLKNAVEIAGKKIDEVKVVVNGAGAAAISCTRLYKCLGVKPENIVMCDSKGVIRSDRESLTSQKAEFSTDKDLHTLADAMKNADVFIGLSKADVVTPEMLLSMEKSPIVFAMANPNPEIDYELAMATRDDLIMGTGRSDFPNQINNVLCFPFIFRGALDVRSTGINEKMKMAAVHALAKLAKEPVPEQVNLAYGEKNLNFGPLYIIPKPFDPRLITAISPAVARAAMDSGIALAPITDWEAYEEELLDRMGSDQKLIRMMQNKAKLSPKRIVFCNAEEYDVLKAAQVVYEDGIAIPILLGDKDRIEQAIAENEMNLDLEIIDPKSEEQKAKREVFAQEYWKTRYRKGVTIYDARREMEKRDYFGSMMVKNGEADALLSGYSRSYASTLTPLLNTIGAARGVKKVCGMMLLLTKKGPIFLADTAVIKDPSAEELADIAIMTSSIVESFGYKPRIAMVSYTNFQGKNDVAKIKKAVNYLHKKYPDLCVDGEIQPDFALDGAKLKKEYPFSKLAGEAANVLIFPNLTSGNLAYKLVTSLSESQSIGPILVGMNKPMHIMQMQASTEEIVNLATLAVLDVQMREETKNNN